MNVFLAILASLFVEDGFLWWFGARVLRKRRARKALRGAFHGFMAFQTVSLAAIVAMRAEHFNVDTVLPTPAAIVIYLWHLLVAPLAFVVSLVALAGKGLCALPRIAGAGSPREKPLPPEGKGLSRREFLATAAVFTPPLVTLALSAVGEAQLSQFRVRRMRIVLPQLPPELDGLTIAHVSDTHVGRFTHGAVLGEVVKATNALKADLALFTGDLINDALEWLPEGIDLLGQIDAPVVLCEGNHDLIENPRAFEERVKASGLSLLINETQTLRLRGVPVQCLGLRWGGPPQAGGRRRHDEGGIAESMEELLRQRDPAAFPILLAHHPHAWDYAEDLPLTLSGHTHGGQLMLTEKLGAGPMMYRYWSGLYTRPARGSGVPQALVVSNGVGNWFPLRTRAPAEIVHLTLACR